MQVSNFIVQIDLEQKAKVYELLTIGSRPSFDFLLIIATFGLITNSTAVIIGVILVAPFILPLTLLSRGAISGKLHLFWRSVEADINGIVLAIGVVTFITLLPPNVVPGGHLGSNASGNAAKVASVKEETQTCL